MKDIPVIEPKEIITTITNMKTGEVYKDDIEWKAKGIPEYCLDFCASLASNPTLKGSARLT